MARQGVLFDAGRAATISPDGRYRYTLRRGANPCGSGLVDFILLNPSTADDLSDDPTVRRCQGYARYWGYGDFVITNLFGLRATDPMALRRDPDPIGPDNDRTLVDVARSASLVICGWGVHGQLRGRGAAVRRLLADAGVSLHYLRLTAAGYPAHPLYLPGDLEPIPWEGARP